MAALRSVLLLILCCTMNAKTQFFDIFQPWTQHYITTRPTINTKTQQQKNTPRKTTIPNKQIDFTSFIDVPTKDDGTKQFFKPKTDLKTHEYQIDDSIHFENQNGERRKEKRRPYYQTERSNNNYFTLKPIFAEVTTKSPLRVNKYNADNNNYNVQTTKRPNFNNNNRDNSRNTEITQYQQSTRKQNASNNRRLVNTNTNGQNYNEQTTKKQNNNRRQDSSERLNNARIDNYNTNSNLHYQNNEQTTKKQNNNYPNNNYRPDANNYNTGNTNYNRDQYSNTNTNVFSQNNEQTTKNPNNNYSNNNYRPNANNYNPVNTNNNREQNYNTNSNREQGYNQQTNKDQNNYSNNRRPEISYNTERPNFNTNYNTNSNSEQQNNRRPEQTTRKNNFIPSNNQYYTTQNPFHRPLSNEHREPITNRPSLPDSQEIPPADNPDVITGPDETYMSEAEKRRYLDLAERLCEKHKSQQVNQLQAIPLLPSPDPVSVNISNCLPVNVPLVVGGRVASIQEFPHMALLGWRKLTGVGYSWKCGGSLVSDNFVLTAAHCGYQDRDNSVIPGPPRVVQLGSSFLDDPGAIVVKVKSVIRHPEYKLPKSYNDLAMVKLISKVSFSERIKPACLGFPPPAGDPVIATGWGRTEFGGEQSEELRSVSINIWNFRDCQNILGTSRKLPEGPARDSQICAGEASGGKDTCQGDSGGPVQIQDECMWRIVAVTSLGKSCGAAQTPGLYAIAKQVFIAATIFGY